MQGVLHLRSSVRGGEYSIDIGALHTTDSVKISLSARGPVASIAPRDMPPPLFVPQLGPGRF